MIEIKKFLGIDTWLTNEQSKKESEITRDEITINKISSILWWTKPFLFLKTWDNWKLYIDLKDITDLENFQKELSIYITEIFEQWLYFNWLNRKNLETILYWKLEDIEKISDHKWNIQLAENIETKKINQRTLELIYNWMFASSWWVRWFKPLRMNFDKSLKMKFIDLSEQDILILKSLVWIDNYPPKLNIDQFIVFLWSKWVRFWINYDKLKKIIDWKINNDIKDELELATPKNAISDEKDIINILINLKVNKKPKINEDDWTIDFKRFECSFPQAKKGNTILTIKRWKKWFDWKRLDWRVLSHKIEPSTSIEWLIQEWLDFIDIKESYDEKWNSNLTLIANKNIFITKSKTWKLYFWEEIINTNNVGPETWIIEVVKDWTTFHQKWTIERPYELLWYNIKLSKEKDEMYVSWKVTAIKNINVRWNWVIISWGNLKSLEWNISIPIWNKIHLNSHLEAINWRVKIIWNIEQSEIIADEIIINWNVELCTLKWRNITILWSVKWSTLIWENIKIEKDLWNNTNILLFFYILDKFKRNLEFTKNRIVSFNERLETFESEIEKASVAKRKEILEKHKEILIIKIKEDLVYQESLKQFLIEFEKKYTKILKIRSKFWKSQTILYPIDFILSDDLYDILSPDYNNDIRTREKKTFYKSLNEVNFITDIKWYKKENMWDISFNEWYELLLELLKSIFEKQKNLNINPNSPRLDTKRYITYLWDIKKLYSDDEKIREKAKSEAIEVDIDWIKWCYLSDLSSKWSSFIIPIDKLNLNENSTIDVEYNLDIKTLNWKTIKKSIYIKTTFWITRIEKNTNYVKIAWLYLDNKIETQLIKYLNYLETNKINTLKPSY